MIKLRNAPKWGSGALPRTVAPADTYRRLRSLMPVVGVTHVVDISPLDRLGYPIHLACGPITDEANLYHLAKQFYPQAEPELIERLITAADRFPLDGLVSGKKPAFSAGKGLTEIDSKVSAMMEAVEYHSASQPTGNPLVSSYRQIKDQSVERVVDPRSLILISPESYNNDIPLEWTLGTDLLSGKEMWIPAEAGTLSYSPLQGAMVCSPTPTGLGAGNTLEEAVCHGLAEAIEHDAWTLAIARSTLASAERGITEILLKGISKDKTGYPPPADETYGVFIPIDLESLEHIQPVAELLDRLLDSGAELKIHDLTSDIGIPVFSVSITGPDQNMDGGGLGSHPDARLALTRALTEAAQQRFVADLRSLVSRKSKATRWIRPAWESSDPSSGSIAKRSFQEVESVQNGDILEDIHHMLKALKRQGLDQVIVVDLTKPELEIPVVKVIVPGLADVWASDQHPKWGALGPRVQQIINLL